MSGAFRGAAALPQPKKLMSNGAMAAVLASFVGLSYYWSMYAVGGTDLEKEVQLEVRPGFCVTVCVHIFHSRNVWRGVH